MDETATHLPVLSKPAKDKRQNVFHSFYLLLIFQGTFCSQAGGEIPSINHAKKLFTTIFFPPADFFVNKKKQGKNKIKQGRATFNLSLPKILSFKARPKNFLKEVLKWTMNF